MLAYDRSGRGAPLVLVHGVGLDRRTWNPVRDRLARKRDVIALDLPGHGASPPLPDGARYDVPAYAGAVQELIKELGLDRPHIAGNSLGGAIALELARTGAVRTATALSPIGFWNPAEIRYTMASLRLSRGLGRMLRPVTPALLNRPWFRALAFAQYYGHPANLTVSDARAALEAFRDSPGLPATLPFTRHYRFEPLPAPQVPVTVGWGTRDRLLLPRQGHRARDLLPDARHVRLPGCGHVPMPDDPGLVARLIYGADH